MLAKDKHVMGVSSYRFPFSYFALFIETTKDKLKIGWKMSILMRFTKEITVKELNVRFKFQRLKEEGNDR